MPSLHFTDRDARTRYVIERFKGLPGEWSMLKGLLCADHGLAYDDPLAAALREHLNTLLIAQRMDDINREQIEEIRKSTT